MASRAETTMSADLKRIPALDVESSGVHFRYLVFRVTVQDQDAVLVRAVNFRPYREELDQRIVNWAWESLEEAGLDESQARLEVGGGGSLSINPYYLTVTVFGASPRYGAEEDREAVAGLVQDAFPDYEVSWYTEDHFEEQEKRAQEEKAAAAAARKKKQAEKKQQAAAAAAEEEAADKEAEPATDAENAAAEATGSAADGSEDEKDGS